MSKAMNERHNGSCETPDTSKNDFGKMLKSLRLEKGLTQEEVAQKMEGRKSTISRYENGKVVPSRSQVERLAQVLGIQQAVLLTQWQPRTRRSTQAQTTEIKIYVIIDDTIMRLQKVYTYRNRLAPRNKPQGPYWRAFYQQDGKKKCKYLGKHLPAHLTVFVE